MLHLGVCTLALLLPSALDAQSKEAGPLMAIEQAHMACIIVRANIFSPANPMLLLIPQMPALFFGINRIFGKLDKAAYARLSRAVTAWMDEKRQVHRI